MNLLDIANLTEDSARDYLESIRWPNGPVCPHCKSTEATKLKGKSTRPGVYKCKNKECRKQFTVTVKTIMERSHIPIKTWVMAFYFICSSKKGMSAHQLHRSLGCTYKTAWFMCHRIRHAMGQEPLASMLLGKVEVDETFVGGKPRKGENGHTTKTKRKTPVVALIQRDGEARARVIPNVTAKILKAEIRKNVDPKSTIMTDELRSYHGLDREFAGHGRVKHSAGQHVDGDVYTNTAESFFSLLKRGHYGTFHRMSKEHLQRYCDEFEFRWNYRKSSDGERMEAAIKASEGKRLTYQEPLRKLTA